MPREKFGSEHAFMPRRAFLSFDEIEKVVKSCKKLFEFEWENKVAIATAISELGTFLEHIISETNMRCLTPQSALGGTSSFLAANLYAKSIFGEDALVNVSVEKKEDADGKLSGYIRIRSKTQGIALSLGDRITAVQRRN